MVKCRAKENLNKETLWRPLSGLFPFLFFLKVAGDADEGP